MANEKTKPKVNKKTIKRLLGYITKKYKKQLILVVICIIISSIATVSGSLFLQTLIDDYIDPLLLEQNPIFTNLLKAIGVLAFIYLAGIITSYLYNKTMAILAQAVLKDIRNEMFSKMQHFPVKYFDTHTHGDIMSHYTNDTDALMEMIARGLPQFIVSTISIIAVICAMFHLSWQLTIVTLIIIFLTSNITKKVALKSSKYFVNQQKAIGKLNGFVEEMVNGQKVVKVFCYEDEAQTKFDNLNVDLYKNMTKAEKFSNILMPIAMNLGNLQYVLVAIIGAIFKSHDIGVLTVGAIASFLQLIRNINMPITQIMQQLSSVIMALAGAERIFALIDEKPETDDGYVTLVNAKKEDGKIIETDECTGMWAWKHPHKDGTLTYEELKGHIEMFDVDFAYEEGKTVLHDISLYAKPGQKIAFVGATGAGKTTITNLINRFYDIEDGKIRYDGININKIKKADLRKSLGMVLQDTNLFTGTIKDNISYGKENATIDEVIEAAKIANADGFIKRLPQGYDTFIAGNRSTLSQGQKQLIAIARAAINNPPVMILDEATSSIDTRTEKLVQDGMDKLMEGRTVFVIAHRLSTVRNSKAIMVLENGRIIERGDHDMLMAEKGEYYQLYTGVFELE